MKEILAAVLSEDEHGNFDLAYHLDAPEELVPRLDKMLSTLVQARAAAQPPVSPEPPRPGESITPIVNSGWRADPDIAGNLLLSLHHPALGWVTWHLPRHAGHELSAGIVRVLDQEAQPPAQVQ